MYRTFRKAQHIANAIAQNDNTKADEAKENEDAISDDDVEESIKQEVEGLWHKVEKQCNEEASESHSNSTSLSKEHEWNIVRVFVSSTFTDFFNEREILVKRVFPELREWCQQHGLKLLECDLRWGIPKDTSTGDVILVCLDEIERCRQTNKNQPFFINLLGERYGWMPSDEEVPDEAKEKYNWISGASITFMEIMEGAYRDKNPNAAFFPRDKSVCDDIPESFCTKFVDAELLAKYHLKILKKKIKEKFPNQIFPYNCKYKQISTATGREQVEIVELDKFAEDVLNFLKKAIEGMYPYAQEEKEEIDRDKQESDLQWLFVTDKAKDLIGRESELKVLKDFAEHGTATDLETTEGANSTIRDAKDWDCQDSDNKICVLQGSSGWGKTALVCKFIVDMVESGSKIFYHIVSSTPSSNREECLLRRMLQVLIDKPTDDEQKSIEGDDTEKQKALLRGALSSYGKSDKQKMIFVIDGLNELESSETVRHLSWLPPTFPHNIHCIVSTNPHLPTTARIYEHATLKMNLETMSLDDLAAVAVKYLEKFNKVLEPSQLKKLMSKTGVDNPLWILLMAEELRIFGDFRQMDAKIDSFPNTMHGFLEHILDRLIQEDDQNQVIKKVLCLIACSRHGLPTDNILQICGNLETKDELAPLHWARARRTLKPYIRTTGLLEETLTFSHEAVLKAVHSHLLKTNADLITWHTVLADFYQYSCTNAWAKVYHLPYHLERAGLKKRIVEFMRKDPDIYIRMNPWQRSAMMKKARCRMLADSVMPGTMPVMLCQTCASKTRSYNPSCTWQNKRCCMLCSDFCNTPKPVCARACSRHGNQRGKDFVKCYLCNFTVNLKSQGAPAIPALLCQHCAFANGDKTCAIFDV